ncbi:MAG TPA: PD-(D/E)XK nuclease family protein [Methylotenera sp.]|nr:PD-(D/E)XK nuclease family protein [Methylotenera sp.]HPH04365.1 PD-(D/E)XK nuclease family protein [Methylotenera sp.]HPM99919.1 PD-(D/E)XK nuclease family protein [Methylotenera sp.]
MQNPQEITICATTRLARGLALQQVQTQLAKRANRWQTAAIYTLQAWLDKLISDASLLAIIPSDSLPSLTLSPVAEATLWEQAIATCLEKHEAKDLFDIRAMAKSAMEANNFMLHWQIPETEINHAFITQETRQFLRWQHTFAALCSKQNAIELARLTATKIALVGQYRAQIMAQLTLPKVIQLAGFDRITPLETCLFDTLKECGVQVKVPSIPQQNTHVQYVAVENANAECRAAVAWAKQKLQENPQAQLAIISPALGSVRRELADLLDDAFHPETLHFAHIEKPRCYDFSLGFTLTEYPIIHSAIQLLRLACHQTSMRFDVITSLLQNTYWGKADDLDARAQLDAHLRKHLSATYSLDTLIKQTNLLHNRGVALHHVIGYLETIAAFQTQNKPKQSPSAWAQILKNLLVALDWAQSREISSHEYQAQQAFYQCLNELAYLTPIVGNITAQEAVQKLTEICNTTMFQPEAKGNIRIQILGLLETPAVQLDAVWAMNMNDHHWPPPVNLNPLLPADIQRKYGTPNASAAVQSKFATLVQQRILHCAPEVIFSYAISEDERELRPSPLIAQHPVSEPTALAPTLAEQLAQPATMQLLDDDIAPAIAETENVRGGVNLFATQAVCPAWAFYQYRLGAGKLETPVDGLDTLSRGSLLHLVLQHFWQDCKNLSTLKALDNAQRASKIKHAIEKSIQALSQALSYQMPPQVLQIEQKRLLNLMQMWLDVEQQRADFAVQDCEKKFELNIEGLTLKLTIDRIDHLNDDSLVVLDYKSSNQVTNKSWADERIAEPQLPIYAVLALNHAQVSAVAFAKVRMDDTKFIGLSAEEGMLPSVKPLHKLGQSSPFNGRFQDWQTLLVHWRSSLTNIALEIKTGEASVIFANEANLDYCDVRPLLRIPERALQFERTQINAEKKS